MHDNIAHFNFLWAQLEVNNLVKKFQVCENHFSQKQKPIQVNLNTNLLFSLPGEIFICHIYLWNLK